MKSICLMVFVTSMFAFYAKASSHCIDLSGTYRFDQECSDSTYNADTVFLPQPTKNASHGIHLGSDIVVSQSKCDALTISYYVVTNEPHLMVTTFDRMKRDSKTNPYIRFSSKSVKFGSHKVNLGSLSRFRFDWVLNQDSNSDLQVDYNGSSSYFPFGTIHIKHSCKLIRVP